MGVRFPSQQQRPDFLQVAPRPAPEGTAEQQRAQAPPRPDNRVTQSVQQQNAAPETQRPERNTQIERAAANSGVQTPGTLIDLIA